jgi:hypothetical protein
MNGNNDTERTDSSPNPATSLQQLEVGASEEMERNQSSSQLMEPSSVRRLVSELLASLESMFWPKPPEGFKRITWRSPVGKPLYIDVRESVDGAAERLQERFTAAAQKETSASSPSFPAFPSFLLLLLVPLLLLLHLFLLLPPLLLLLLKAPLQVASLLRRRASSQSPNRGHDRPGRTVSDNTGPYRPEGPQISSCLFQRK